MEIITSFLPLLQDFAMEMTHPTFQTFTTLIRGWVFAPRRTILGMVRASPDYSWLIGPPPRKLLENNEL